MKAVDSSGTARNRPKHGTRRKYGILVSGPIGDPTCVGPLVIGDKSKETATILMDKEEPNRQRAAPARSQPEVWGGGKPAARASCAKPSGGGGGVDLLISSARYLHASIRRRGGGGLERQCVPPMYIQKGERGWGGFSAC